MNKVRQGQSFLDMVLQSTGSIDNAILMAVANNMSLTSELIIGQELKQTPITDQKMVGFFTPVQKRPATAWNLHDFDPKPEGISYWAINIDFIVS